MSGNPPQYALQSDIMESNGKQPTYRIVGVLKKNAEPFEVATNCTKEVAERVVKLLAHGEVEDLRIEAVEPQKLRQAKEGVRPHGP